MKAIPDAKNRIAFDKFHVAQYLGDAVDKVRRVEQENKMGVYRYFKLAKYLHSKKIPILPNKITYLSRIFFGGYIPHTAQIGEGTLIGYEGIGVVIHDRAVIGNNCIIGPGVVIGGTSGHYEVPRIGNNVLMAAGAKILGPVKIGNNVVIGANAVVTKNIPDNCMVVGIPAKIIKTDIDIKKYNGIAVTSDTPTK